MDPKEHLQTMVTSLINGDERAAQEAVHQYVIQKSQEIAQRPADATPVRDSNDNRHE